MKCKTCNKEFKAEKRKTSVNYCFDCLESIFIFFESCYQSELDEAEEFAAEQKLKVKVGE